MIIIFYTFQYYYFFTSKCIIFIRRTYSVKCFNELVIDRRVQNKVVHKAPQKKTNRTKKPWYSVYLTQEQECSLRGIFSEKFLYPAWYTKIRKTERRQERAGISNVCNNKDYARIHIILYIK